MILRNSGKTSRYVWASCLSRIIALQNFPIRFPHSSTNIWENRKFWSPTKAKGSRMPLVRAEYHGLLRRVVAHGNQGRKVGAGAQFPGRRMTAGSAEQSQQSHKHFTAVNLLPKYLRFEHRGADVRTCFLSCKKEIRSKKLASYPGRHLTSLHP